MEWLRESWGTTLPLHACVQKGVLLRGPSNVNMNNNNPTTHEVTREHSNDDSLLKELFDDFYKFGRNILFGRVDDIRALNIRPEFTDKIQSSSLICRQYKRTLPAIGT